MRACFQDVANKAISSQMTGTEKAIVEKINETQRLKVCAAHSFLCCSEPLEISESALNVHSFYSADNPHSKPQIQLYPHSLLPVGSICCDYETTPFPSRHQLFKYMDILYCLYLESRHESSVS